MKKFWKTANFRLKAGLISTCFFLIIGTEMLQGSCNAGLMKRPDLCCRQGSC